MKKKIFNSNKYGIAYSTSPNRFFILGYNQK